VDLTMRSAVRVGGAIRDVSKGCQMWDRRPGGWVDSLASECICTWANTVTQVDKFART